MFKTLPLLFVLGLLCAMAAPSAHATQQLACVMRFHVVDADSRQPVVATVTVADTRSGWVRTRNVNSKGRTIFRGIRPDAANLRGKGHQRVIVSAPGYEPQAFEGVACPHAQAIAGRIRLVKEGGL